MTRRRGADPGAILGCEVLRELVDLALLNSTE
jgi:hypothetical protein